jgi:hypothetical protein
MLSVGIGRSEWLAQLTLRTFYPFLPCFLGIFVSRLYTMLRFWHLNEFISDNEVN